MRPAVAGLDPRHLAAADPTRLPWMTADHEATARVGIPTATASAARAETTTTIALLRETTDHRPDGPWKTTRPLHLEDLDMMTLIVGTTLPRIHMAQDVRTTDLQGTSLPQGTAGIPESPTLPGTMIVVDTGNSSPSSSNLLPLRWLDIAS